MENNEFKEGTMELLGSLLSAKECHIQMLRYRHTHLHTYTLPVKSLGTVSFIILQAIITFIQQGCITVN